MQSTPGDRQPLEDEGLKAGQHGRGLSTTSHTTCIGPSNTYSGSGLEKKKCAGWLGGCVCVCVCAQACMHGFVWLLACVCLLSVEWDSVLMMKDSRAIE